MSLPKSLKIRFNDKETKAPIFEKFNELVSFIKNDFSIEDKMPNLHIFYYDYDGDEITFKTQADYNFFMEDNLLKEKIIECEIINKETRDISIEKVPVPMKNGTVNNIKNLNK